MKEHNGLFPITQHAKNLLSPISFAGQRPAYGGQAAKP